MTSDQYVRLGDLHTDVVVNGFEILEADEIVELAQIALAIRDSITSKNAGEFWKMVVDA